MKFNQLLSLAGALMLAVSAPAQAITFLGGAFTNYTITQTGYYAFEVAGAQGGRDYGTVGAGGGGALISGKLFLGGGSVLTILAGAAGGYGNGDSAGGGGGMSFIALGSSPLIVAGGGAGQFWFGGLGGDGQIGNNLGGHGGLSFGGAGASFYSSSPGGPDFDIGGSGESGPTWAGGVPNLPFTWGDPVPDGMQMPFNGHSSSGGAGGFGGGGGGGYSCGGGGGGFNGGGACGVSGNQSTGGDSYITPTALNVTAIAGGNHGEFHPGTNYYPGPFADSVDGFVTLEVSSIPEPATWAMLMLGFSAIGVSMRRSKRILKALQ